MFNGTRPEDCNLNGTIIAENAENPVKIKQVEKEISWMIGNIDDLAALVGELEKRLIPVMSSSVMSSFKISKEEDGDIIDVPENSICELACKIKNNRINVNGVNERLRSILSGLEL